MNYNMENNIFFTSDTHFGHKFMAGLRKFNSVEEMDELMIKNWNSTVQPNDIVYHLGDFAFASNQRWKDLINILNGKIHLILGNHDISRSPNKSTFGLFEEVTNQKEIAIENQKLILNHYPLLCYAGTYRSNAYIINLFGHVHSCKGSTGLDDPRLQYCFPYQYDVGMDLNNFTPISYEKVKEKIEFQINNNTNVTYWSR